MKHSIKSGYISFRFFLNLSSVGTSRRDVPARATAGGTLAPLNAVRTAQRAIPTSFRLLASSHDFEIRDASMPLVTWQTGF
jgi:hypothetical protein